MEQKEIDLFVAKLRQRYKTYAEEYDKSWFNSAPFEERYQMAIRKGMDMEAFLLAEIDFINKLKNRYDIKTAPASKEISDKIDNIIEENNARIEKYKEIKFHQAAGFEISHLYGALNEFTESVFSVGRLVSLDPMQKRIYDTLSDKLIFFAISEGLNHPKRILDHILVISRLGSTQMQIDRDAADYLKGAAFLLHDIINFCNTVMNAHTVHLDAQLKFSKLSISEEAYNKIKETFSGKTGFEALSVIKERAEAILDDFRLRAFKKNAN